MTIPTKAARAAARASRRSSIKAFTSDPAANLVGLAVVTALGLAVRFGYNHVRKASTHRNVYYHNAAKNKDTTYFGVEDARKFTK